jgi:DNA-entry nuclease
MHRKTLLVVAFLLIAFAAGFAAGAHAVSSFRQKQAPDAGMLPADRSYTPWYEDEAPNYYRVAGEAVVDVRVEPGEIVYSGLDELGRTGRAVACVTFDMMEAGMARDRSDMSSIKPAGWGHNEQVEIELIDGRFYHGYLYNRSHLIAKSLGGADIRENLVTGTRMQNVGDNSPAGGMLFGEQVARDWLTRNPDGWVYYSATPVYEGDELLCRSVIVDMRSSDGSLDMQIEVYNAALGFEIDYATGEFSAAD